MNTEASNRPDPQALLSRVKQDRRGALKIFIGASPGVGKTYKMLEAAHEAAREGTDIVIGIVESHGRQETEALCEELESVPTMTISYRDAQFQEMDLDTIVKRSPSVVLVDELAHRNIPGTRHPRRYQDIEELLDHGIDVWTTINIQHLESLNDVVARITGVRMRETVPDQLISGAQDLVLVDLTPNELIERLKQGKVYVPDQARAALDGFFSPSNLAALRELVFQTVAERLDRDVSDTMRSHGIKGPWPIRTRILVAIDGLGNGPELVRFARRLADRRQARWSVVFVDRGDIDPEQRAGVQRVFELAERLGGETVTLRGYDPVAEILAYARDQNVSTLVVGRSRERPLAGFLGLTLSQRLLRQGDGFEISFVPSQISRSGGVKRRFHHILSPRDYTFAAAIVAAAVIISAIIDPLLPLANLSLVFMTAVLLVAVRTGMRLALITVVASALAYNFFFTEPRYTFVMDHPHELLTVGFFLIIGLIGGQLAGRLRNQVIALRQSNEQTQTLLSLNRRLAAAIDLPTVYREAATVIMRQLHLQVVILIPDDEGQLTITETSEEDIQLSDKAWSAADWGYHHQQSSGFQTDTLAGIEWRFFPLLLDDEQFGMLGVRRPDEPLQNGQIDLIEAMTSQVSLAMARSRLATSLEQAKVTEEMERLRSALLSSVSHDLRTPLSSMIGAASSLQSLHDTLSDTDRLELLDSVISEGNRLDRYIQNLLDMTRLGHGTLKLARDWIGFDDILNSAIRRTRELLQSYKVSRDIDPELPLLYVHAALIEQALVNVIENAAKFSPDDGEIHIKAWCEDEQLIITITDDGPGIPPDQRKAVFDMFFTGGEGDLGKHGSGLGLAICSGMIGAHGGHIEALDGPHGNGTTIAIYLPIVTPSDETKQANE
ncbi:two-component system sensor histidine kinase KdpD [Methylohalomonas lacus]|uniref:histidine kinase n=1 Tax=Methylohalomonas lacus TaxID=398773 RepID=A0AAE3HMJ3_9GAMM|nr:sensor histidine kinase KdpD [Methylohalomonas lacus]MCS3904625.1 two-component system sensor histidine kinase KdpD [Methylohalomonas lacus]